MYTIHRLIPNGYATVREYAGHFEVHVTTSAGDPAAADGFAVWCGGRGLKCVRIVLARGTTADQPMATWRRAATTLSAVRAEAETVAADAVAAGFAVARVKIEADPHNAEVPIADADAADHDPGNYFEHHVKLRRERVEPARPPDALLSVCDRHAAHLSRNAFRDGGTFEERFVTLRGYGIGRATAAARFARLVADLRAVGETVAESESEYCVFDTNLRLDAGWLPGDAA